MGDLTRHFSLWEFRSRDGAEMPEAVAYKVLKTAEMLESIRAAVAAAAECELPIDVLSGYRSPKHNADVGGVPNSYHLRGMAADIAVRDMRPVAVQNLCLTLQKRGVVGGVGVYDGFTHVDWGLARVWGMTTREALGGASD